MLEDAETETSRSEQHCSAQHSVTKAQKQKHKPEVAQQLSLPRLLEVAKIAIDGKRTRQR